MTSTFSYNSFIQYNNLVCGFNGSHSVSDDQNSLAVDKLGDGFLYLCLIVHIQRGGRFIKQNHRGIF